MTMKIMLVSATSAEADILKSIKGMTISPGITRFADIEISLIISGVGSVATAWAMSKHLSSAALTDLAVNIGIAGSYNDDIGLGEVVMPVSDCFADAGIDTGNGFLTLGEAGLEDPDRFPFKNGKIYAENRFVTKAASIVRTVNAITVNTASGTAENISRLVKKYNPDIETMEGATFFYICCRGNIPFLALRSVSNKVEPRNKSNWNIELALKNLSEKLREVLQLLE
ncbi:MAG: futalosine hydrolase [Bacteroidota bacterium]|nr:futalosine hydrolase [Bacteroidota bacterium]